MRWRTTEDGDIRQRRSFLALPKLVSGEWRWLEHAQWCEEYDDGSGRRYAGWYSTNWIDEPVQEKAP